MDVLRENITGVQKTLFKQDASERWEVLRNLTVFQKWQLPPPFLLWKTWWEVMEVFVRACSGINNGLPRVMIFMIIIDDDSKY